MVNAGLLPAVVVDDFLTKFWKKVFPDLVLQENVAVRSDASLGIAIRKENPQRRAALNNFMRKYGPATSMATPTSLVPAMSMAAFASMPALVLG
jgi:hypothetical protein